ncbi:MAG: hypothetical protein LQ344_006818 [Seirophora lacunosa]|nr:MAG: hypothetical protein LQ344_006818 [Seirophora lacunosa]
MRVEENFRTVATALQGTGGSEVNLTTAGSTWALSSFQDILHQHDQSIRIGALSPTPKPFSDSLNRIPSDAVVVAPRATSWTSSGAFRRQEIQRTKRSSRHASTWMTPTISLVGSATLSFPVADVLIKKPGNFDQPLFNISTREALQMGPAQRMLLMTTYDALELASYTEQSEHAPPRIGAYFGKMVDDWKTEGTIQEQ